MRLIGLAVVLAFSVFVAPLTGEAQLRAKVPRIGVLGAASPESAPHTDALRQGLRELGYVEGQNMVSEWRWARGDPKRFSVLAGELVQLAVDVIVADNNPAIAAAQKATGTIPIVMVISTDPVGLGFVASLARPGGNITGLSFEGVEHSKRLQLLKEAAPNVSKIAILAPTDFPAPSRR
jgi:putative tryptophan/tyrosine transport system substrate-binding protein